MTSPALEQINAALATVNDPEIHRPITDLGMVESIDVDEAGRVSVRVSDRLSERSARSSSSSRDRSSSSCSRARSSERT